MTDIQFTLIYLILVPYFYKFHRQRLKKFDTWNLNANTTRYNMRTHTKKRKRKRLTEILTLIKTKVAIIILSPTSMNPISSTQQIIRLTKASYVYNVLSTREYRFEGPCRFSFSVPPFIKTTKLLRKERTRETLKTSLSFFFFSSIKMKLLFLSIRYCREIIIIKLNR